MYNLNCDKTKTAPQKTPLKISDSYTCSMNNQCKQRGEFNYCQLNIYQSGSAILGGYDLNSSSADGLGGF